MLAATQPAPLFNRRAHVRVSLGRSGTIRVNAEPAVEVFVLDLTRDGCRIETHVELAPGAELVIGLAGVGSTPARAVWRDSSGYGCEFHNPLPRGAVGAAFADSNVSTLPGITSTLAQGQSRTLQKWATRSVLMLFAAVTVAGWTGLSVLAIMLFT